MLVNNTTKSWLDAYIARPRAALLLYSPEDIDSIQPLQKYVYQKVTASKTPNIIITKKDKKSIGVDEIREIKKQLSMRSDSNGRAISRMVTIQSAELLTPEAQNALLKLLEELPERTIICLTTSNKSLLLETVLSRCFLVTVLPIDHKQATDYADSLNIDHIASQRAYLLSEGRQSVFESLLMNKSEDFDKHIADAKNFISATIFDRQKLINNTILKDSNINDFLKSLKIVTRAGLHHAKNTESRNRWKQNLQNIIYAESQVHSNVSTKLSLLALSVSI